MPRVIAFISSLLFAFAVSSIGVHAQNKAVGADKCAKMCHKVQFQSWSESKHAKAAKPAECETCHGPGSGYMTISIMKDPAKAKAAGLIAKPDMKTCNTCHKAGEITADMLPKVHAHKPKA